MKQFTLSQFALGAVVSCAVLANADFAYSACGKIAATKGDVKIQSGANSIAAVIGGKVCSGDTVTAGPDARAKLQMEDGNELNVSPDSKIVLENYQYEPAQNKKSVLLNVLRGKVRAATKQENMYNDKAQDGADNSFQVKTKTAVAGVRGTDFMTSYDPKSGASQVVTFRGTVSFGTPGPGGTIQNAVSVKAGQTTNAGAGQPPATPRAVPAAQLQQMNSESKGEPAASTGSSSGSGSGKSSGNGGNSSSNSSGSSGSGNSSANSSSGNSGSSSSSSSGSTVGGSSSGASPAAAGGLGASSGSASGPSDNSTGSSSGSSAGGSMAGGTSGPSAGGPAPASVGGGMMGGGGMGGGSMLNTGDLGGAAGTTGPNQIGLPSTVLPPTAVFSPTQTTVLPPVVPVCPQCVTAIQNSNAGAKVNVVVTITLPTTH